MNSIIKCTTYHQDSLDVVSGEAVLFLESEHDIDEAAAFFFLDVVLAAALHVEVDERVEEVVPPAPERGGLTSDDPESTSTRASAGK